MPAQKYHVVYSGKIREKLKDILRKAKKAGKLKRFALAVLQMDKRLHEDPLAFGELIGTLRSLKLPMHVGFIRPLRVDFAIHVAERIVFVRRIEVVTSIE